MNAVQAKTTKQWFRIKMLHNTTFHGTERKSLSVLRSRQQDGKADVWYFEENDQFIGYAITTPYRDKVLINYLALANKMRGQKKGNVMFKILQYEYAGRGLFAEVDLIPENAPGRTEKMRRKKFYLDAGMHELGVYATYIDKDLELLGAGCEMDFESYCRFYLEAYNIYTASGIRKCKKATETISG